MIECRECPGNAVCRVFDSELDGPANFWFEGVPAVPAEFVCEVAEFVRIERPVVEQVTE